MRTSEGGSPMGVQRGATRGAVEDLRRIGGSFRDEGVTRSEGKENVTCWFCILKQDGKSLHLVHDLQPLNVVIIRDSSMPPFVEHLAQSFTRYAVYSTMDMFAGYNQCPLHLDSWDLTTFNSPLGPHRLTTIPMG